MQALAQNDTTVNISNNTIIRDISVSTLKVGQDLSPRPLWLTEKEAESLLVLCTTSPANCGVCEQALFSKLSRYLRSFP